MMPWMLMMKVRLMYVRRRRLYSLILQSNVRTIVMKVLSRSTGRSTRSNQSTNVRRRVIYCAARRIQ
jgi:hypothetical protein